MVSFESSNVLPGVLRHLVLSTAAPTGSTSAWHREKNQHKFPGDSD